MEKSITITLSDDWLSRLKDKATRIGVSPEELVRLSLEELLTRPDDNFEQTLDYVLEKNEELYRRLA